MPRRAAACAMLLIACGPESSLPVEPRLTPVGLRSAHTAYDLGAGTATAINQLGDVVGYTATGSGSVAWLRPVHGTHRTLPPLSGSSALAFGVNDRREVAGSSTGLSVRQAVYWTAAGEVRSLGRVLDSAISNAMAISNAGVIAGTAFESPGTQAWIWTADGGVQLIWGSILSEAVVSAMNDAGQVVGTRLFFDPIEIIVPRAYRWSAATGPVVADAAQRSHAHAVNGAGRIGGAVLVGEAALPVPAVWSAGSGWTLLPHLGFGGSVAGLNERDQAVGHVRAADGSNRAALWATTGDLILLPELAGFTSSTAAAINARGWIVGQSVRAEPLESRATLWLVGRPPAGLLAAHVLPLAAQPLPAAARTFTATPACAETWRHFVEAGGFCPDGS